jgi:hypothetical protein
LQKQIGLRFNEALVKCYIWSAALCGAETGTLRKGHQKYRESFGTWCWRRMEKISWTGHVRREEVLQRVKEERKILQTIKEGTLTGSITCCVGTAF